METLARATVTAVLYLLAARYALVLNDLTETGAVFWPAAGVSVTALLVSPRRSWPAILAGVGLVELTHVLILGYAILTALPWAVSNVAAPLTVLLVAQRLRATGFDDVSTTTRFALAVLVGATVGALIGAVGTARLDIGLPYIGVVGQWIIGDALGVLTTVPIGLVVLRKVSASRLTMPEGIAALVVTGAVTVLVFLPTSGALVARSYWVLLPLVWLSVRARVAGAGVAIFVIAHVSSLATAFGHGPFADAEALVAVFLELQFFIASMAAVALLLASRTAESASYQQLAEARAQLVAAVSHELRTPLTPIIGFSELLLKRPDLLDERARNSVEVIHRNGRHLAGVIEDLLQASRARHGHLPVHPVSVEVDEIVAELLTDGGDDGVVVGSPDLGVRAWADPTHVRQILTNLLDNARKYGRPPITITLDSDRAWTTVTITDAGDGVPAAFTPHLFDEFTQAQASAERPSNGLGLGLPIARSLARANGGDLVNDETHRRGACFVVRLPATALTTT